MAFLLAMSPTSADGSAARLRQECTTALKEVITLVEEIEPDEFLTMTGFLGVSALLGLSLF